MPSSLPFPTLGLSGVLPWHSYWIWTPDNQRLGKPIRRGLRGPCCEFEAETTTIFAGTALGYQCWTYSSFCRLGSQSSCWDSQGREPLGLPLSREKRAALSMGICLSLFFPVQAATDGLYDFQHRHLFPLLLFAFKRLGIV